jgi:hypothetical protein
VGHPLPEGRVPLRHVRGFRVSEATVCRTLKRLSHSRKKDQGATQRDEFFRLLWRIELGRIDAERLVFLNAWCEL